MPVIALANQKGGVGKTTVSTNIAAGLASGVPHPTSHREPGLGVRPTVYGKEEFPSRTLLVDADPQGSALDWSHQREAAPLFPVIGLAKPSLHKELAGFRGDYDWVIIDGPPGSSAVTRSVIVASDLVLIPVLPSVFDVWAAKDIVDILSECAAIKPDLKVRFLVNRLILNTTMGNEIGGALAGFPYATLETMLRNRQAYVKSAAQGLTVLETEPQGPAADEIRALVREIEGVVRGK